MLYVGFFLFINCFKKEDILSIFIFKILMALWPINKHAPNIIYNSSEEYLLKEKLEHILYL